MSGAVLITGDSRMDRTPKCSPSACWEAADQVVGVLQRSEAGEEGYRGTALSGSPQQGDV